LPVRKPPQTELDVLFERAARLKAELDSLKYRHRPTVPIYDETSLPQNAVEGQHAITLDGCYMWYQGGIWHEVCPDEGDPFVAVPSYTVVANQVNDAQLTVPAGSNTDENITLIANIPNNWIVFGFMSVGSVTRLESTRKYYLATGPMNIVGTLNAFVDNPGNNPAWVQRLGVGPSSPQDNIAGILNDNTGPILATMAWGRNETGSTLTTGTNIICRYTPGADSGPDVLLGPRAYILVAFDPSVLTLNPNQPGFLSHNGLVGRGFASDIFIRKINLLVQGTAISNPGFGKDILNIYGVVLNQGSDALNFTPSRSIKIATAEPGLTGGAYADKTVHRLYVCARAIAAGLYSNTDKRDVNIQIPFTNRYSEVSWVVSGLGIHLNTTTV
jgi:hypothetical protein